MHLKLTVLNIFIVASVFGNTNGDRDDLIKRKYPYRLKQDPLGGPNVCFPESESPCCEGWIQEYRHGPCVKPLCNPPCKGGLCIEPNLCQCRDGTVARQCTYRSTYRRSYFRNNRQYRSGQRETNIQNRGNSFHKVSNQNKVTNRHYSSDYMPTDSPNTHETVEQLGRKYNERRQNSLSHQNANIFQNDIDTPENSRFKKIDIYNYQSGGKYTVDNVDQHPYNFDETKESSKTKPHSVPEYFRINTLNSNHGHKAFNHESSLTETQPVNNVQVQPEKLPNRQKSRLMSYVDNFRTRKNRQLDRPKYIVNPYEMNRKEQHNSQRITGINDMPHDQRVSTNAFSPHSSEKHRAPQNNNNYNKRNDIQHDESVDITLPNQRNSRISHHRTSANYRTNNGYKRDYATNRRYEYIVNPYDMSEERRNKNYNKRNDKEQDQSVDITLPNQHNSRILHHRTSSNYRTYNGDKRDFATNRHKYIVNPYDMSEELGNSNTERHALTVRPQGVSASSRRRYSKTSSSALDQNRQLSDMWPIPRTEIRNNQFSWPCGSGNCQSNRNGRTDIHVQHRPHERCGMLRCRLRSKLIQILSPSPCGGFPCAEAMPPNIRPIKSCVMPFCDLRNPYQQRESVTEESIECENGNCVQSNGCNNALGCGPIISPCKGNGCVPEQVIPACNGNGCLPEQVLPQCIGNGCISGQDIPPCNSNGCNAEAEPFIPPCIGNGCIQGPKPFLPPCMGNGCIREPTLPNCGDQPCTQENIIIEDNPCSEGQIFVEDRNGFKTCQDMDEFFEKNMQ